MGFQWLGMRITEEKDRRERESQVLARLPRALEELRTALTECLAAYCATFGAESAAIEVLEEGLRVVSNEKARGSWRERDHVDVTLVPEASGVRVQRGDESTIIEIGVLPGDHVYYKEGDAFLNMEDLTRRILDRTLFPKLGE
jgi:hypothetical protein